MATKLSPVGSQFQVNQNTGGGRGINFVQALPEIVALSDGRFAVVYESNFNVDGTDIDVLGQFVNANGTLSGAGILVDNPGALQINPALAARGDGGFTTVWEDYGTVTASPNPNPDIYYAIVNSAGGHAVTRTVLMNHASFNLHLPAIATLPDGRQIVVAELGLSSSNHDIHFDVLAADGVTQLFNGGLYSDVDVSAGLQLVPRVAAGPNRALVVYDDNNGEANGFQFHVTARLFNGTTNTFGPRVLIADAGPGHSMGSSDVAYIGSGRFVIVYQLDATSILARIYNSDTGALSPEIAVSSAAGATDAHVAATQDGGFIAAWNDPVAGSSVFARRFDPYGNPFGDAFVVNTLADGDQAPAAIGISGGRVMTVWADDAVRPGDNSPTSIQAQAFIAPGFDYDSAHYGDFDANGRSDLLFQNLSTGAVAIWTTNSAGVAAAIVAPGSLSAGFKIDSTGNFNSTPGDDILLRSSGGQVAVWVTSGTAVVDFKVLGSAPAVYLNAGNGDFTGDGQSDLLFRHAGTGEIATWQVVDNALAAPAKVLGSAPNVYQIVAVADFTGDHQADILFRNLSTGEIAEWQVANNQLLSAQVVGSTASTYHVVGTGDFDGNGANDILFRHDAGELVMWLLNSAGQLLSSPTSVGSVSNIYHVDGTGDLNGDGRSDIIFRDPSGNVVEWLMNGASAQAIQAIGTASQDFSIAAHHFDLI